MSAAHPESAHVTPSDLFFAFALLTLHSFGGALFWSRRMLIEKKRWLSEQEFVEMLALSQLLPSANGVNLAVMVGYRFAGWKGAAAAMAGFLGGPIVIIIGIGVLYEHFGAMPLVKHALGGMASAAVGLLLATAVKLAKVLQWRWRPWMFVVLAFAAVGIMRWPLLLVVGALAPFAIAAAWKGHH